MFDAVIDISHHNALPLDFDAAAKSGIAAVIHKATQGTGFADSKFSTNRAKALDARLLFGSYHFGTGDDATDQAEFYLRTVGPRPGELLALDFEANTTPGGSDMTLEGARAFVSVIHDRIGRWPVLYAGGFLKDTLGGQPDPVLTNCPLWLAQYSKAPVVPVGWSQFMLWQWTDGTNGIDPKPVTGIGACDRERFAGAGDELAPFWASVSAPSATS